MKMLNCMEGMEEGVLGPETVAIPLPMAVTGTPSHPHLESSTSVH